MSERSTCSRDGCPTPLPADESGFPPGWTVARIENYGQKTVETYYAYLCPNCTISATPKQAPLFGESNMTTENT